MQLAIFICLIAVTASAPYGASYGNVLPQPANPIITVPRVSGGYGQGGAVRGQVESDFTDSQATDRSLIKDTIQAPVEQSYGAPLTIPKTLPTETYAPAAQPTYGSAPYAPKTLPTETYTPAAQPAYGSAPYAPKTLPTETYAPAAQPAYRSAPYAPKTLLTETYAPAAQPAYGSAPYAPQTEQRILTPILSEFDIICQGQPAEAIIPIDNNRKFVVCIDTGKGTLQECPKGLFFHPISRRCERTLGALEDACISQPCLNGGQCVTLGSSYQCQCTPGYDGVNCELDARVCQTQQPCGSSYAKCQSFRAGAALSHMCIFQDGLSYGLNAQQTFQSPCSTVSGVFALAVNNLGFVMCDGERTFIESCPGGTIWDDAQKACSWPYVPVASDYVAQGYGSSYAPAVPRVLDSYGSAPAVPKVLDSYAPAPAAPRLLDSYGSAPAVPRVLDSYGSAPAAPKVLDSYAPAPAAPRLLDSYGSAPAVPRVLNSYAAAPVVPKVLDSYAPAPAAPRLLDSYGSAPAVPRVLNSYAPAPAVPRVLNSYAAAPVVPRVLDSYGPAPAAPRVLNSYGSAPVVPRVLDSYTPAPATPQIIGSYAPVVTQSYGTAIPAPHHSFTKILAKQSSGY